MSGGSYDYAYNHMRDDVARWASVLRSMADRCRRYAIETESKSIKKATQDPNRDPKWGPEYEPVPMTVEDRARILVKALRLEECAKRIEHALSMVDCDFERIMHDVEWVASGDYGPAQLIGEDGVF